MGGPTPSTRASPRLYCRPVCCCPWKVVCMLALAIMRPMRPWETRREINGYPFTTFDSFPTFLGELDSRYQSFIHMATCSHGYMFFFRWCPPEELDNKRSSSSSRRVRFFHSRGDWSLIRIHFLAWRFRVVLVTLEIYRPIKKWGRKPP
jgi:hypothetical protein